MIQSEIHNINIEQAVLSTLMTVQNSYSEVENKLSESDFYANRHQAIFKAIVDLDVQNKPCDAVLVLDWLISHGYEVISGGEEYLMKMMADSPSSFYNLETYVEKLKDLATCRKVEKEALQVIHKARHLTVSRGDLVLNAQTAFAEIDTEDTSKSLVHMHDITPATLKLMEDKLTAFTQNTSLIKGIQTGVHDLDKLLGDIEPGSLVVVAARPAMGKTTMLQVIANHVSVIQNKPTVIMSGEMSKEQIAMRMCCAAAPADIGLVRNAPHLLSQEDWSAYIQASVMFHKVPLEVNDTSRPSIANVRESVRKIKHKYGSVGVVMVDYLQIMKTSKQFAREDLKIAYFSGELKALAKEFNCVVVLLSQLNRELEKRPNKRPVMSDLRESGAIEQDADQIVFLYRDEVYHKDSKYRGVAEAIVGKNRHGELGTAYMHSQLKYCQFDNLDQQALEQIQGMQGSAA